MPSSLHITDWAEITLTGRCNQRCFFCYEDSRSVAADPPLEEVKRILVETRKHAEQAVLCGKEVLLRPDIIEIIEFAKSLGLRVVVFSNGQALAKPGMVEAITRAGCTSVVVSFHFPDEATFEKGARTKASGFQKQMAGLARLREYNLAHPELPVHVSTETDMFVMNTGRLAEMRQRLVDTLGTIHWSMRLGSLLPSQAHEIGLTTLLEPFAERQAELATFLDSQPAHVPIQIVKSPLCLIPARHRHLSLELAYLANRAGLTFNHAQQNQVTVDTMSISGTRDVAKHLREFPYRWVCRTCPLVSVCRFERTSWLFSGFEASLAQKPCPVPEEEARLLLEGTTQRGSTAPTDPYPEELLLQELARLTHVRLLECWALARPGLGVALEVKGHRVELALYVPPEQTRGQQLGFVAGYLDCRPLNAREVPEALWEEAIRAVGSVAQPDLTTWQGTPHVDLVLASTLQRAWKLLGEGLWTGVGGIAGWRSTESRVHPDGFVKVSLAQEGPVWADVWVTPNDLRVVLHQADPLGRASAYESLLRHLALADGVSEPRLPSLGPETEGSRVYLSLASDRWVRTDAQGGVPDVSESTEGPVSRTHAKAEWAPSGGQLRWVVTFPDPSKEELRFGVAAHTPGAAYLHRIGNRVLWYKGRHETPDSKLFGHILVVVMKHLDAQPLTAQNVDAWELAVRQVVEKNGLQTRFQWKAYWEE